MAKYETSAFDHDDLLVSLFAVQPIAALDGLCGGDQESLDLGVRILCDVGISKHPLSMVPDEVLLAWCDEDPQTRYPAMAGVVRISKGVGEYTPPRWTNRALRFLEKAPELSVILRKFTLQFRPTGGWVGSLAATLESNATLLDELELYPQLRDAVNAEKELVKEWIAQERRRETHWDRQRDERFE